MSEVLVGALAHAPGMTGFPERAQPDVAGRALDAVASLRARIEAFDPEVVVGVSNDHFTSTSMRSLAPFAIGIGPVYDHPATERLVGFLGIPRRTVSGHPRLAQGLLQSLLDVDVDVTSMSGRFGFDENFSVPIHLLGLADTPFVPVLVNAVQPPMPSPRRCVDVGVLIGHALRRQTLASRVAVIATGGLSHSVGTPTAGTIDEQFDTMILGMLAKGRLDELRDLDTTAITAAGNGAEEVRQWLVAAGVAAPGAVELIGYQPVPEWLSAVAVVCTPAAIPA